MCLLEELDNIKDRQNDARVDEESELRFVRLEGCTC